MAKKHRQGKKQRVRQAHEDLVQAHQSAHDSQYFEAPPNRRKASTRPLEAKTEAQGHYILSINENTVTFGVGPAGTGKTYICAALAAEKLLSGEVEKVIITRPAVEAGESLGFLPGELEEKFDPFLAPVREVLEERLGAGHVEYLIRHEKLVALPLAYMRGHTFKDAFVILDEAQNATVTQMKLFLTRIGENSTIVINGDGSQIDIETLSGLQDAVGRLGEVKGIGVVQFGRDDIVRHGIIRDILDRYDGGNAVGFR